MSYFIFLNNSNNIEGTLYKIAENQSDLNNLNISQPLYHIIEDSQNNFDLVKYGNKTVDKYINNDMFFTDISIIFDKKEDLQGYINSFKSQIKLFLDSNKNHPLFNTWQNYYNQLNNLNLNNISYPLNMSLEQYFKDQNQTSLSPLQLP
jgi:hypothetical protein